MEQGWLGIALSVNNAGESWEGRECACKVLKDTAHEGGGGGVQENPCCEPGAAG